MRLRTLAKAKEEGSRLSLSVCLWQCASEIVAATAAAGLRNAL